MDQYQLTDDYVSCIQFRTPTYVPGNFGYESRNEVENKRFTMMCTQYWDAHESKAGLYDIIEGKMLKVEVRKK